MTTTRPARRIASVCAMYKRCPRSISALTIILRKLTVTRERIHTRVPPGPAGGEEKNAKEGGSI